MTIKLKIIIKYLLTFSLLFFSFYLIFLGYSSLDILHKKNFIDKNNELKNEKILITDSNKKITELKKENNESNILQDEIILTVKKNDTFGNLINKYILDSSLQNKLIYNLNDFYDLKKLKIGQKIYLYKNIDSVDINKIIIPINFFTDIIINIKNNNVSLVKKETELTQDNESKSIIINTSVYDDGIKANLPVKILSDAIRLLSFDVDFQRDIQKGNKLEISFETYYNNEKDSFSYGNIKYIKLSFNKNFLEYFFFKTDEGFDDYFTKEGKNVKKALLKTPLDGARLSSSFGMRKHPISGYNKLHKGVDFAAPIGTPIYAGGNGVIEFVGRNGGYGKYIRIRHNNSYKTAYAHLNNYKKGIYKGLRVNQGEVIGYVGSTGKSTGPHLHYEIILDGKQINPMSLKLPPQKILKNDELKRFIKESDMIYANFLYNLFE
tara:strand:+ start:1424 stop:2731 length:1308 start_codon:yes stop_codon:yes gene_type:complete